jgi:uncharacterized peroxidase-related enzyme
MNDGMTYIAVPPNLPGIIGPLAAYPESGRVLRELAETLLQRETPTFARAERELVAAFVSRLNECVFCSESHGAAADHHAQNPGLARKTWENFDAAEISERLKAFFRIAAKVQRSARSVAAEDIEAAKRWGATDGDIHDAVLIAAAFCMYNRYVDGLGTSAPPSGSRAYVEMGRDLAEKGYLSP